MSIVTPSLNNVIAVTSIMVVKINYTCTCIKIFFPTKKNIKQFYGYRYFNLTKKNYDSKHHLINLFQITRNENDSTAGFGSNTVLVLGTQVPFSEYMYLYLQVFKTNYLYLNLIIKYFKY